MWLGTGISNVGTVNGDRVTCMTNHLTAFAVVKSKVNPITPITDDINPTVDSTDEDDDYVYNFWGCMNAFYIGLILWFFWVVFAIITRRMDTADNHLPKDARLNQVLVESPREAEGEVHGDAGMWRVR